MLNNMKIGFRLALAFGIVIVLLVVISATSLMRLADMNAITTHITEDRMLKIEMSSEMIENTLVQARAVRNLVIAEDKAFEKRQVDIINDIRKRNGELLDKIRPTLNTVKGKELFERVMQTREKFAAAIDTVLPIAYSASPQYNQKKAVD